MYKYTKYILDNVKKYRVSIDVILFNNQFLELIAQYPYVIEKMLCEN